MTDIRQSPPYAYYMETIGWKVEKVGKWNAFIKQFPLIGSFIKIQRIGLPIPFTDIQKLAKKYRAFRIVVELSLLTPPGSPLRLRSGQAGHTGGGMWRQSKTPYTPSKTIHIDLTASEDEIFQKFTEAKRRAVRRAIKNNIIVKQSNNINEFIKLKKKQDLPFGFLIQKDLQLLWQSFFPKYVCLLLAYQQKKMTINTKNKYFNNIYYYSESGEHPLAGILLLFYNHAAYYWQAAATKEGRRFFAPTLLVWEALKFAKMKGCKIFDFEGIYDERFPEATKNWQGFTKFKEGFGGEVVYYPKPFLKGSFSN